MIVSSPPSLHTRVELHYKNTPMKVIIQAGEFEVFKSIFQTSIPYLLGWNTTMDIASAAAISRGLMGGGGNNY